MCIPGEIPPKYIYRVLNEQFPLSEFTHLKRVRGGESELYIFWIAKCFDPAHGRVHKHIVHKSWPRSM